MTDLYEQACEDAEPDRYLVEITRAIQIPAIVFESERRAEETGRPQEYILKHEEAPNVIRGYSQPLDGGIRRSDGGLSWYHNETGCLNRAYPLQDHDQRGQQQENWGETVTSLMASVEDRDNDSYTWFDADIYTRAGQISGTSGANRNGVRIERACWYEDDPRDEELTALLEHDNIEPERFYDQAVVPEHSVIDHLQNHHDYEPLEGEAVDQFITEESWERARDLQEQETGDRRGSCLLGPDSSET